VETNKFVKSVANASLAQAGFLAQEPLAWSAFGSVISAVIRESYGDKFLDWLEF
jgi:uncharacterized protein (DUF697 family)